VLAREYGEEEIVVVQETEYTGAGKHPTAQLTLAREMGIEVRVGRRSDDRPGQRIVIPPGVEEMAIGEVDLAALRRSYLRRISSRAGRRPLEGFELGYLAEDLHADPAWVAEEWEQVVSGGEAVASTARVGGG
jgi:hypothetical protein